MAVYTGTASSKILQEFQALSEGERHRVQLQLLEGTEAQELKVLYEKIKQLLSFDCLAGLPIELAEKVLLYLDVASICAAAQCCRKWRDLANRDTIWYALCQRKSYIKFENLPMTPFSERVSISPHHKIDTCQLDKLCSATNLCKWKLVYIKANALMCHWKMGIYKVPPLLKGHRLQVTTIGCSNNFLVSGSSDNTSRIWNLKSLECLHVLEGHTDAVNCIAIKNDIIVTGCSDSVVRAYDVHSGQCLKLLHGHSGSVDHIAFDGSITISAGSDCSLLVWDVKNGKLIHTLIGHTEEIECLIFEEENIALTGSWDCTLRIWDIIAGICKMVLTGHTEVVYCCTYVLSGDNTFPHLVYSGGGDAVVKAWDMRTGDNVLTLQGHTQEVLSIKCNKELIASASSDSTIRIWKVNSGMCSYVLRGHIGVVRCLSFKGDILISGGDRKRIIAWNTKQASHLQTGEELYTVHKQQSLLHRLCVTDTQIITASPDSPGSISIISYW